MNWYWPAAGDSMGAPSAVQLVTAVARLVLARTLKFRPVTLVKVRRNVPFVSRVPVSRGNWKFNL